MDYEICRTCDGTGFAGTMTSSWSCSECDGSGQVWFEDEQHNDEGKIWCE